LGYGVSKVVVLGLCLVTCIELALFCPLADQLFFPTRFCNCRGFNEASGDLFYEVDFTVLLLFVAYLLLCLQRYAARGEVS